jgi:hypothetical protein
MRPLDQFACFENIKHFEHLLLAEADPEKRAVLHRLLAEERAKVVPITPTPLP